LQLLNIAPMLTVPEVLIVNNGTDTKDLQVLNMPFKVVALEKSNCGTDVKPVQLLNMLDASVTNAVLNNGTDVKLAHP
jgi:hypothetical protein